LSDIIGGFDETSVEDIHQKASGQHRNRKGITGIFTNVKARWFWMAIHAAIVILGGLVAFT
jgi:hypothetical protein